MAPSTPSTSRRRSARTPTKRSDDNHNNGNGNTMKASSRKKRPRNEEQENGAVEEGVGSTRKAKKTRTSPRRGRALSPPPREETGVSSKLSNASNRRVRSPMADVENKRASKKVAIHASTKVTSKNGSSSPPRSNQNPRPSDIVRTPPSLLLRIEAALCTSSAGRGSVSLDEFYSLARTHEWLGRRAVVARSQTEAKDAKGNTTEECATSVEKQEEEEELRETARDVQLLASKMTEEESLLLDLVALGGFVGVGTDPGNEEGGTASEDKERLYPLYRIKTYGGDGAGNEAAGRANAEDGGGKSSGSRSPIKKKKMRLEMLQPPTKIPHNSVDRNSKTKKSKRAAVTYKRPPSRMDVLGELHQRWCVEGKDDQSSSTKLRSGWWEHAASTAEAILVHRIERKERERKRVALVMATVTGSGGGASRDDTVGILGGDTVLGERNGDVPLISEGNDDVVETTSNKSSTEGERKKGGPIITPGMTLEERVRVRADHRRRMDERYLGRKTTTTLTAGTGNKRPRNEHADGDGAGVSSPPTTKRSKAPDATEPDTTKGAIPSCGNGNSKVDETAKNPAAAARRNSALLELADALRSYSVRRGTGGSGGVARLPVSEFLPQGGGRDERGRALGRNGVVASVDLARVLRKMPPVGDDEEGDDEGRGRKVSRRKLTEVFLLELLEDLEKAVPRWIGIRSVPTPVTSSSTFATPKPSSAGIPDAKVTAVTEATSGTKRNIKRSIIVIRNKDVDYRSDILVRLGGGAPKRAHPAPSGKLGGTVKAGAAATATKNGRVGGASTAFSDGKLGRIPTSECGGSRMVADTVVPQSFRRLYGAAILTVDVAHSPARGKKNSK